MAAKPKLKGYIVIPATKEGKKDYWHNTGAVLWAHKNGEGLDLDIPPGISLSGRVTFLPPKDDEPKQD